MTIFAADRTWIAVSCATCKKYLDMYAANQDGRDMKTFLEAESRKAEKAAEQAGWLRVDEKHLCPNCVVTVVKQASVLVAKANKQEAPEDPIWRGGGRGA